MATRKALLRAVVGASLAVFALAAFSLPGCGKGQTGAGPGAGGTAAKAAPGEYVNTVCPIMSSPIDPGRVTPDLTRRHKGKTVAFCCGSCPPAWDKLTDAEKDAKLAAATARKAPGGVH